MKERFICIAILKEVKLIDLKTEKTHTSITIKLMNIKHNNNIKVQCLLDYVCSHAGLLVQT